MFAPTLLSYYTVTIFASHQVIPIFNAYCSRHHLVIQNGTSEADVRHSGHHRNTGMAGTFMAQV